MKFTIAKEGREISICAEETAFAGVVRVAKKVAEDIRIVTDRTVDVTLMNAQPSAQENRIIAATLGRSAYLEELADTGAWNPDAIKGKREVYDFFLLEGEDETRAATLVIAGSDKRGTIYGLFHLSELLGVSPWVYFADVMPRKRERVVLTQEDNKISKEPSVKYRGFFINDEWPSFGNWTFDHFGGFTAEMYDKVFELLLRLKGNYLWPAMWTSSFSLDGPGLENARLADEYGIVMSNSHHEPCLRHSEEWDLVRGEDSVYGNEWNYDRNKEGLTNYWRDGLKRNGCFENIVTMGMRGERDSEILGRSATLEENISYLKEVITTQNQLIQECISKDLDQVPRMLAIYKEVEEYFYGDEQTQGLKDWEGLDGVTCMLCEDNFGNMRKLPTKENRDRKGGWGMYYHFDYHGDPISYEWVNSTHLSKVWEQMTQAYEFGIRDIWIVNVGDLKPQELPLSYFLDLAYDYDKWGISAPNKTQEYTKKWVDSQFAAAFNEEGRQRIYEVLDGYTRINSIRKPEALYPDTYHPVHYLESDVMIAKAEQIIKMVHQLENGLTQQTSEYASFFELVYYPAAASMNQLCLQLYAGKNELYAKQGRTIANQYVNLMRNCIEKDRQLKNKYHTVANCKWNGMMSSEHIGFVNWNDEECRYPIMHNIEAANKPRLIVANTCDTQYTMGGDWTRRTIVLEDFCDPKVTQASLDLANGSREAVSYRVSCDAEWITLSQTQGIAALQDRLILQIDRSKMPEAKQEPVVAKVTVQADHARMDVLILALDYIAEDAADRHYVPVSARRFPIAQSVVFQKDTAIGAVIEADEYAHMAAGKGQYQVLRPFGKFCAGVKAFPITESFTPGKDAPALSYELYLPFDGEYEITVITAPSNPVDSKNHLRFGFGWNQEAIEIIDTVTPDYKGGERSCPAWADGVLDQEHSISVTKYGTAGVNTFTIAACDPGLVIERFLIKEAGPAWKKGYLGKNV